MGAEIVRRNVIVTYESKTDKAIGANKKLAKSTSGLGSLFKSVGAKLGGAAVFAAFVVGVNKARKTIAEFETSLKQLESLTGLSGDVLDKLGDKAIQLSGRFGTSAKDIVDGFAKVGSAAPQLLDNADALAEVTGAADVLSKAAGITLDESIDAVTKTMNQYGISANRATEITDILATSQQKGTARITSLTQSLKNVGSVAAAQGISLQNTNAHLQALAKGGLEGAEAGTKLRAVYLNLAKTGRDDLNPATQDFNDILKVLGKEVTTVNQAQKLFGKETAAAALTLIKQADTVAALTDNLFESGNALEQASINTDTATASWEKAETAFESLILSIDSGKGVLGGISKAIADDLTAVATATRLLSEGVLLDGEFFDLTSGSLESRAKALEIVEERMDRIEKRSNTLFSRMGQGIKEPLEQASQDVDLFTGRISKSTKTIRELSDQISGFLREDLLDADALGRKQKLQEQLAFATQDLAFESGKLLDAQNALTEASKKDNDEKLKTLTTLGELKVALKDAKKLRDTILLTETGKLDANEAVIKGLQKRIKALSIVAAKEKAIEKEIAKDSIENRKAANEAIELLKISLIRNDHDRAIATIELQARKEIEILVGAAHEIAEQKVLIEKKAIREIITLQIDAQNKLKEAVKKTFADSISDEEERIKKIDEVALKSLENGRDAEILSIQRQEREKQITEEEGQEKRLEAELKFLMERVRMAGLTTAEMIALNDEIAAKQKEQNELNNNEWASSLHERVTQTAAAVTAISGFLSSVLSKEQEQINKSITLQEKRVARATELAEKGNAEILQLEEERLLKLTNAREKAQKKQQQLQAIQIAANAALTISSTILAIAEGTVEGGIPGAIATGVVLAATVAAAVIAMQNAFSNIPAFATGEDIIQGAGTGTSDSITAKVSRGERIVPAKTNKKLVAMGITNKNIAEVAAAGIGAIGSPALSERTFDQGSSRSSNEYAELKNEIAKNTKAIENIGVKATIDSKGFTAAVSKRNKFEERRNKMMK